MNETVASMTGEYSRTSSKLIHPVMDLDMIVNHLVTFFIPLTISESDVQCTVIKAEIANKICKGLVYVAY